MTTPRPLPLREELAALCHEQWSGWMRFLFQKSTPDGHGKEIIPQWAVERWMRQMNTPYQKLSDEEKESDRKEADRVLALVAPGIARLEARLALAEGVVRAAKEWAATDRDPDRDSYLIDVLAAYDADRRG
jgi:hypothetical protein